MSSAIVTSSWGVIMVIRSRPAWIRPRRSHSLSTRLTVVRVAPGRRPSPAAALALLLVLIGGKIYDSWRYIEGLLFKDEEGTIPAGCPGEGSSYTGGSAYLRGKPVDHETGTLTIVTGAKFGSNEELSFAFKDVMMFVVMKGWICDPLGREEEFEGSRCYDRAFNERDAEGQQSLSE